ncbi:MAG: hypothetical protein ABSH48_23630 [Verrucomicrobiota bacterium]
MKISDDYNAKQRLWAASPTVVAAPGVIRLPGFESRRFGSHAEMNDWKASALSPSWRSVHAGWFCL